MSSEVCTDIVNAFDSTEESRPRLEEAVDLVLTKAAEQGYVLVKARQATATDYDDFAQTLAAYLSQPQPPDYEVDTDDFHADVVIHELRKKGWLILPPHA